METLTHKGIPPVRAAYTPPPSQFGEGGFTAFAGRDIPEPVQVDDEVEDGPDGWFFPQAEPPASEVPPATGEAAVPPWPQAPRPARAVNWRGFDELILGPDTDLVVPERRPEFGTMATAALVISLSGMVTGLGFFVGIVLGQMTLRRIGRAGWFHSNEPARRRARNAVMVGYTGIAVVVAAILLAGVWWLVQTPLETLLPDVNPSGNAVPAAVAP